MESTTETVRKFKSLDGKGKRVYCRGGDVRFRFSDVYETSNANEINALLRASRVVEIKDETAAEAPASSASTTGAQQDAGAQSTGPKTVQEMTVTELKEYGMKLGLTEEALKAPKNKGALLELVMKAEAEGVKPAEEATGKTEAELKFEENKEFLKSKNVEVTDDMTPDEVASLVSDLAQA